MKELLGTPIEYTVVESAIADGNFLVKSNSQCRGLFLSRSGCFPRLTKEIVVLESGHVSSRVLNQNNS